jgi:seryl-tRNA synthetase
MIDIRLVRADPEGVRAALSRRSADFAKDLDELVAVDERWRAALASQEESRARVKELSREVAAARRAGDVARAEELAAESRLAGDLEKQYGAEADRLAEQRRRILLAIPNLPDPACPEGSGPEDNPVMSWSAPWELGGDPQAAIESGFASHQRVPHWEVGTELEILDMERAAKLAGSMFPMYRGAGAGLVRALVNWALASHGRPGPFGAFEEVRPPTLVRSETMVSTGHLPKFADDAYHIERDDLWAIPTAEVPLTSLARDEVLSESELPKLLTAHTSCFRREAGSAGRDTRGLLRVHEFDKVEILALCTPDQAADVHRELLRRAEQLVADLGLAYRVVDLCAGDLGNSAARTFDIEVYAPGCGQWLEVSSVSWFSDYQARRANIRYRPEGSRDLANVHTLNGSAVAVPRIWAAIVETYRQPDGKVSVPEVLRPFMGGADSIG